MNQDIHRIIIQLQNPGAWAAGFENGELWRKEQAGAKLAREYAREGSDDPDRQITDAERANWRRFAATHDNHAEQYRQAGLAWQRDLIAVGNYCRNNAPTVLPLVPNVSWAQESPADLQALADLMVQVEAALLQLEPKPKPPRKKREQANPIRDAVYDVLKRHPKLENDEIQERVENLLSTTFDDDGAKVRHYVAEYFRQHPDKLPPNRRQRPKKRKS